MADATIAVSGAAKTGIAGTALTAAKTAMISPVFGVAALGGIIAFQWWKGKKDAEQFTAAENCQINAPK